MGNFPETSAAAVAAAKSRRFARGRCAFHLAPDSSRKHGVACHTAVVFPEVYMLGTPSRRSERTCALAQ